MTTLILLLSLILGTIGWVGVLNGLPGALELELASIAGVFTTAVILKRKI